MADENKVLLPHRGSKSKMTTGAGKNIILQSGELFIEYPDTGVGTGTCKIKIGDGVTAYASLPYAISADTDNITFTPSTATTVQAALDVASSGQTLAVILGGLKRAIQLMNTSAAPAELIIPTTPSSKVGGIWLV